MQSAKHLIYGLAILFFISGCSSQESKKISIAELKDKIAGGWAGKMIGVSFGAKSEFRSLGKIKEDSLIVSPINNSLTQDDIYVQLSFLETMDKYGIDAPLKTFQANLANAGFMLWHANLQSRKNYFNNIFPPESGMPGNNFHADDIDFQIECDYIGFMNPGMHQSASKLAQHMGQIMNYGDGIYGGVFISSLYVEAFFDNEIPKIINRALLSIPTESEYAKIIRDVVKLHQHYPDDWRATWQEIQNKWGETDICGSGTDFNIDAKLNGAYIIIGLLYGQGDAEKTMEITTRCGQDADCNPSNAMAVLGVIKGFKNLPSKLQKEVLSVADSTFDYTSYTFNKVVNNTLNYAVENVKKNGGSLSDSTLTIPLQNPVAPELRQSFHDLVIDTTISIFDSKAWVKKGNWKDYIIDLWWVKKPFKQALYADKKGDEISIDFNGTGLSLTGNWLKGGGKADVYLDNVFQRTIDTWYLWGFQEEANMSLFHKINLNPGKHTLRVVVSGDKYEKSQGTAIYITELRVYKTAPKKSENFKFSFEH